MNENEIQRAIFTHLRTRAAPGVFAFHPKNGGIHQRGRRAGINSGLGVVAGVPDIILLKPDPLAPTRCLVFALELKTETGKLSPEQETALKAMERAGAICGVAYGLDAALRWLETRKLLKGTMA